MNRGKLGTGGKKVVNPRWTKEKATGWKKREPVTKEQES